MHTPSAQTPQFDEARVYEYPEHLRDSLLDMPAKPGVYIFTPAEGTLPLYIGKSVNLALGCCPTCAIQTKHACCAKPARISHIRTAGEIGALLLEAQLIKQQQPLYNQKLRRNRQLCALRLREGVPEVVYSRDMDFAVEPDLYGLYGSRTSALQGLRELADMHKLCYGALGLRKARQRPRLLQSHAQPVQWRVLWPRKPCRSSAAIAQRFRDFARSHLALSWSYWSGRNLR